MNLSNRATARQTATSVPNAGPTTTLEKLREFLETHGMNGKTGPRAFAEFERDVIAA